MKNYKIVLIFVILIAFLGIGFFFRNINSHPIIEFSEELVDLGKIMPDEKQIHIFDVRNNGRKNLVIESVSSPCACTATVLSEKEIPPGENVQLEVTFNPKGYEGEITESIYIYSNDPKNERAIIAFRADVEHVPSPEIQLSTQQWDLGKVSKGDTVSLNLIISNQGDLDLNLVSIDIPEQIYYDQSRFTFPKKLTPGEELEVNFTFDSSKQETGMVRKYIIFVSNDPVNRITYLIVTGIIK